MAAPLQALQKLGPDVERQRVMTHQVRSLVGQVCPSLEALDLARWLLLKLHEWETKFVVSQWVRKRL